MKRGVLILCAVVFSSSLALAGPVQYQVTGPVLEVRDDVIVVQKGNDKWEIARDKATVTSGDLKVGSKVTVFYTMQAKKIEVKDAPKTPAAPKKSSAVTAQFEGCHRRFFARSDFPKASLADGRPGGSDPAGEDRV